ncbi:hypothetical protein PC112_g4932 [Phytophthora cactorum]|nr:hypothetical protein PC112_g4932 [Phytophthora cactorum]
MKFDEEYDIVHVDEKWFNEDKVDRAYLLLDGEEPPPRDRKSKRFIPKMMFLAAVARPSVNRKKGTLCSRNVAYVDRPLYKHYIIEEVIPDIKAKWPASEHGKTIFIQQDNATPRVPKFNALWGSDDENLDEDTLNMQALDDALDDIAVVDE